MTGVAETLHSMTPELRQFALSSVVSFLANQMLTLLERDRALQMRHLDDLHRYMIEPAWMEAHLQENGHYGSFLDEVKIAWRVADKAGEAIEQARPKAIGWQVRYALLQTSINSLASNIPLEMLLAGIQMGKWSVEASLTYAKQVTHGTIKVAMLAQIGGFLRKQHK